jgi:hypothetical protein
VVFLSINSDFVHALRPQPVAVHLTSPKFWGIHQG